jgi:hypothetical protein
LLLHSDSSGLIPRPLVLQLIPIIFWTVVAKDIPRVLGGMPQVLKVT